MAQQHYPNEEVDHFVERLWPLLLTSAGAPPRTALPPPTTRRPLLRAQLPATRLAPSASRATDRVHNHTLSASQACAGLLDDESFADALRQELDPDRPSAHRPSMVRRAWYACVGALPPGTTLPNASSWHAHTTACRDWEGGCKRWRHAMAAGGGLLSKAPGWAGSASTAFRCVMLEGFPLKLPPLRRLQRERPRLPSPALRRVTLIGLMMRKMNAPAGKLTLGTCRLLRTALPRGWDVLVGVGVWRGSARRFRYILRLLESVPPNSLVVWADTTDVLVQRPAVDVLAAFGKQPHAFIWSAEENCFPQSQWPYNLGIGSYVCERLYPRIAALASAAAPADSLANGSWRGAALRDIPHRHVNGGGWVATLEAAQRELLELQRREARHSRLCAETGSDQWIGEFNRLRPRNWRLLSGPTN